MKRDAFLYLEPKKGQEKDFAQCKTCMMWTGPRGKTCTIHGSHVHISAGHSCGLYVAGPNHADMIGKEMTAVSAEESGLVKEQVRCENCKNLDGTTCLAFKKLDLDDEVKPKACCNGWEKAEIDSLAALRKKANEEVEDDE